MLLLYLLKCRGRWGHNFIVPLLTRPLLLSGRLTSFFLITEQPALTLGEIFQVVAAS